MLSFKMPACRRRAVVAIAVAVAVVGVLAVDAGRACAESPAAVGPTAAPPRADTPDALPRPLDVEIERHAALGRGCSSAAAPRRPSPSFAAPMSCARTRASSSTSQAATGSWVSETRRVSSTNGISRPLQTRPIARRSRRRWLRSGPRRGRPRAPHRLPASRATSDRLRAGDARERPARVAPLVGLDGVRRARGRGRRDGVADPSKRHARARDGPRRQEVLLARCARGAPSAWPSRSPRPRPVTRSRRPSWSSRSPSPVRCRPSRRSTSRSSVRRGPWTTSTAPAAPRSSSRRR